MPEAALYVRFGQAGPIPLEAEFACESGELLALVGPSGSGKTTLLRAIAGLYRPRAGTVRCNGRTWFDSSTNANLAPQRRRVGLLFQSYALFPHLTALENVKAGLGHLAPGRQNERAKQLLDLVHLGGLEKRLPRALSGGQQQRVALARALARDPEVLLLDEPFSAVDQVTRRKLQRELAQLHQRLKIPIVMVTHDLEDAARLADRMVVLQRGKTLQCGTPFEVLARPADTRVARLVDYRNLFRGEILAHDAADGCTKLAWQGYTLEASYRPEFAAGSTICWGILATHCILHRVDRPSRGEHENPVSGVIGEFVPLGDNASITMWVNGKPELELQLSIPMHVAQRNALAEGSAIKVSLLREGLHIMPYADLDRDELSQYHSSFISHAT